MALLSRSSLRGSVRRTPDEPFDDDGLAPPMKRQRTTQENGLRRRRSSPDCLDTTTLNENSGSDKARPANPPLKAARPRTSTRRTRRPSASSVDTDASGNHLETAEVSRANGNGVSKAPGRHPDREILETTSETDLLRGARESPDPLDTISQAEDNPSARTRSRASSRAAQSKTRTTATPATTRATRRSEHEPAKTDTAKEESRELASQSDETHPADATRSHQKLNSDQGESEQPAPERTDGRRSLRSADSGSRCKSELAQYFYNYEQLISLDDPEPGKFCTPFRYFMCWSNASRIPRC